jgi:predicted RNA binding protein YcfA (HicA-like mRNA interferase family)
MMKCAEMLRILKKNGWYVYSQSRSHVKLRHNKIKETIIFPNHGSQELGKGLEQKIRKVAGIK